MNWKIEIKPRAVKQYSKLDKNTKKRIKESLKKLETMDNPLVHSSMKALSGSLQGDYRLRVGDWRLLLTPDFIEKILHVYAILPRGSAYK